MLSARSFRSRRTGKESKLDAAHRGPSIAQDGNKLPSIARQITQCTGRIDTRLRIGVGKASHERLHRVYQFPVEIS
eukprot:scaffold139221_cov35-Tisochrysis_lutea.AAC.9